MELAIKKEEHYLSFDIYKYKMKEMEAGSPNHSNKKLPKKQILCLQKLQNILLMSGQKKKSY
ncbi:hypothetical protein CCACVL1_11737 [Corchorus capsularis]|uniref:Uncharacterized protein n=1 Tax=Corchorus capsularis TaxID=210143 RepID=A0A1R3IJQ6_COCAP|nr:hypothetical protein CCACVL1_11737 [Corchorus capsularis]